MPIVFVHGVNNRVGDEYRDNEAGRNGFLRQIVAPALGLSADNVHLSSPYWGGEGARFRWNMAVLPDASARYEQFGGAADTEVFGRVVDLRAADASRSTSITELAKRDFPAAVDMLYAATLAGIADEEESRAVAASYQKALAYAQQISRPDWLDAATDDNFADQLYYYANADVGEQFGAGAGILNTIKEGLSRFVNAWPDVASDLTGRLARKKLNATVTRFAGDVFTYLTDRDRDKTKPGKIAGIVLDALKDADQRRTASDKSLIVIAHSFGGEIVYDLATSFAANLQIDWLITVGSQVGLFEEMKLYAVSKEGVPPDPPQGKLSKPRNVAHWLNVFDTNDILSYCVSPIFDGAVDFHYDGGYSTVHAHGGYFLRPSFYVRLADRLTHG